MTGLENHDAFVTCCLRQPGRRARFVQPLAPLTQAELAGLGAIEPVSKIGAGILAYAPAAGPAAPFVAAVGIVASILGKVFGPDPRNVPDTQNIEAAQIELNRLWYDVSGEKLPFEVAPGQAGAQHVNIFQESKYPSVPYGPAGNAKIDIEIAIRSAEGIIQSARSFMQKPASLQNPFFTGGGNNIPELLRKMRSARGAGIAPKTTPGAAATPAATGTMPAASLLSNPLVLGGIALGAILLFSGGRE